MPKLLRKRHADMDLDSRAMQEHIAETMDCSQYHAGHYHTHTKKGSAFLLSPFSEWVYGNGLRFIALAAY